MPRAGREAFFFLRLRFFSVAATARLRFSPTSRWCASNSSMSARSSRRRTCVGQQEQSELQARNEEGQTATSDGLGGTRSIMKVT